MKNDFVARYFSLNSIFILRLNPFDNLNGPILLTAPKFITIFVFKFLLSIHLNNIFEWTILICAFLNQTCLFTYLLTTLHSFFKKEVISKFGTYLNIKWFSSGTNNFHGKSNVRYIKNFVLIFIVFRFIFFFFVFILFFYKLEKI